MNNSRVDERQLEQFLELFDGDSERAIAALKRYQPVPRPARQTLVHQGPVLVELDNVTKTYKLGRQTVEALRGASLQIRQGEFVAIVGPSGSGKSTLLQLIGALDTPTNGTILVDGADLRKMRDSRLAQFRAQTIGFVFQFFYLQPFLSLRHNIEVPAMFARQSRASRRQKAIDLASKTGLEDRLKHYPKELSGGQMQRAAIARALMNSPKILLADEPTGNLDTANGRAIVDLFDTIRHELGMTVVVVTHDQAIADRADRVITVRDGEVV